MSDETVSPTPDPQLVTGLLRRWSEGDKGAFDELMPVVYGQLRKLAASCLGPKGRQQTLHATALVHEAYLRLVDSETGFENRAHFYAVAARVLRHILVDHAKAARRQKRGAGAAKVPLDETVIVGPDTPAHILDVDEALKNLEAHDARKGSIVELLFFGGMTYEETAAALEISPATVHRELTMAKAWMRRELARI